MTIETGKLAKLADGAVTVRCGDTIILVTAVSATKKGAYWRNSNAPSVMCAVNFGSSVAMAGVPQIASARNSTATNEKRPCGRLVVDICNF
jgi:hypothetical protein